MNIIEWAHQNSKKLGLQFTKISWTDKWDKNLHEYSVKMNFQGIDLIGRGTDTDRILAITKAIAELMERRIQIYNGIQSSSGMAAHTNPDIAARNARIELLERDLFVNRMISQSAIPQLDFSFLNLNLIKKAIDEGIKIKAFELGKVDDETAIMVISYPSDNRFGISCGLGISNSRQDALHHACIESLRRLIWVIESKFSDSIDLAKFKSINKPNQNSHFSLALDANYSNILLSRITTGKPMHINHTSPPIYTRFLEGIDDCPLLVCQAKSSQLQPLRFGVFLKESINWNRFHSLNLSQQYEVSELLPHPLA